jgi:hypothetical protein
VPANGDAPTFRKPVAVDLSCCPWGVGAVGGAFVKKA